MAIKTQVSLTMYSFIKTKFLMDNQIKLNNSLKSIPIPKILLYFKCVSRTIMRCYKMYLFDTFISVGYLTQIKYRCLCLFYLFIDTLLIPFFVWIMLHLIMYLLCFLHFHLYFTDSLFRIILHLINIIIWLSLYLYLVCKSLYHIKR